MNNLNLFEQMNMLCEDFLTKNTLDRDFMFEFFKFYKKKFPKSSGRPSTKFEKCLQELKNLTRERDFIEADEVARIKSIMLVGTEFSIELVKKSQKELGYVSSVTGGQIVSWKKINTTY